MTSLFPGYNPPNSPAVQSTQAPQDPAQIPRVRAILQMMQARAGMPGMVSPGGADMGNPMVMGTRGPDGSVMRGYHPEMARGGDTQMRQDPSIWRDPQATAGAALSGQFNNFDMGSPIQGYIPPGSLPVTTGTRSPILSYPGATQDAMARAPMAQSEQVDPRLARFSPGMQARLKPFFVGR